MCRRRKDGARSPRPAPGPGAVGPRLSTGAQAVTLGDLVGQGLSAGVQTVTLGDLMGQGVPAAEAQRIGLLAQLGQLHRQGILTDSEFAAQKAELLSE